MQDTASGRFCSSCQKNVIDFTQLSDAEVVDFVATHQQKLCGRFSQSQLTRINQNLVAGNRSFSWKNLKFAAIVAGLIPFAGFAAKAEPPQTEQHPFTNRDTAKKVQDTTGMRLITGQIVDGYDKLPIPGVYVSYNHTRVQTDTAGIYRLYVPDDLKTLEVAFVGYKISIIDLKQGVNKYDVVLEGSITGGIVVSYPFHKRVWHKIKHLFSRN
ncbi:hypothetical protein GCM10023149_17570 [Mucilaginibacter gynuensis]|uniref:Carboxypeptidase-like protein n=2 Tax=Mucilaginibacter gynuensis TaxID=1302236 RepID=A0ABP8G8E9_9SPHI